MRSEPAESDDDVVQRFKRTGDNECFAILVDRYGKKVFFACLRFFSNEEAARDATQDAFLQAFQAIDSYEPRNFQSWLLRIAHNVCVDAWRRSRNVFETELVDMPSPASVEQTYISRQIIDQLCKEMESLPSEQRVCVDMKVQGYSYEEIAAHMAVPVKTVKSHIQNGRRMLWKKLRGTLGK